MEDRVGRLVALAKQDPTALSSEGLRTLSEAGVDLKAVFGSAFHPGHPVTADAPLGFDTALTHPSGLLIHGPGSADMLGNQGTQVGSTVFAVLSSYVRAYAEPPLRVWRGPHMDLRHAEVVDGSPADAILQGYVNPWMDAVSFMVAVRWGLLTHGNYYAIIVRGGEGTTIEDNTTGPLAYLWPVPPHQMKPGRRKGSGNAIDFYSYDIGKGRPLEVPVENVIHWRGEPDPMNPLMGIGPLRQVAAEVLTDAEAEQFIYYLMRNSGVPGLIFTPAGDKPFSQLVIDSIKETVRARTTGSSRGDVFVTPQGADVSSFQFDPGALDLSAVWMHCESRIASVIGWPAILVGLSAGLDAATYNNTKELREMATETILKPAWSRDVGPLNRVAALFGLRPGEFIAYDWTGVSALQEDQDSYRTFILAGWDSGLLSIGQVHDALDMELPAGVDPALRRSDIEAGAAMPGQVREAGRVLEGSAKALPAPCGHDHSGDRSLKEFVELEEEVEITDEDIEDALRDWDAWAGEVEPEFVGMLGAVDADE